MSFNYSASGKQSSWNAFWQKFKSAVVKGDKQTVRSLTAFELSDRRYNRLFGTKDKKDCFARAKPTKERQADAYTVFCGNQGYYFEKIDGQYKFSEPFADD